MTLKRISKQVDSMKNLGQSHSGDAVPSKAQSADSIRVRILTHNIRYATEAPFKGEERWPIRCPRLCGELVFNSLLPATFICLQEVLHEQLLNIRDNLNESATYSEEWAYIGVGREDGREAGEYSPIFYRPSVWKVNSWNTVWLSETPSVPSKGWDASSIRIATIGQFIHHDSGQNVIVTSTHFDNDGAVSRKNSAKMLLKILEQEAEMSLAQATILAGDFNSSPNDEAYQIITGTGSNMVDVCNIVPREKHYGNENTFTGFSDDSISDQNRIDFIFARKYDIGDRLEFKTYAVLANRFDDGVYSSDHRACVADFFTSP